MKRHSRTVPHHGRPEINIDTYEPPHTRQSLLLSAIAAADLLLVHP